MRKDYGFRWNRCDWSGHSFDRLNRDVDCNYRVGDTHITCEGCGKSLKLRRHPASTQYLMIPTHNKQKKGIKPTPNQKGS